MNQTNHVNAYDQNLQKVYAYIDSNLSGDLRPAVAAKVSGYSEYHFHRLFHAMTGTSLHEFVLERRITAAAARIQSEGDSVSITQIAKECGFSSAGDFTQGFWRRFGCSPSGYRKNRNRNEPLSPEAPVFPEQREYVPDAEADKRYFVTELADMQVAGVYSQGLSIAFHTQNVENAFKKLFAWMKTQGLEQKNLPVMGITLDTPEDLPAEDLRYLACVAAEDVTEVNGDVIAQSVGTKGKYICFRLDRTRQDFTNMVYAHTDYLYGYYLPLNGLLPDNRPSVEFFRRNGPVTEITFCVPVYEVGQK